MFLTNRSEIWRIPRLRCREVVMVGVMLAELGEYNDLRILRTIEVIADGQ